MENIFQKLRQQERKPHAHKSFKHALFGGLHPWYLGVDQPVQTVQEDKKLVDERAQVLEKLQDFAHNQLAENTETEMSFPGGAIKLKAPEKLRILACDLSIPPREIPPELPAHGPLFLCLGETDEPAQAELLTKMLKAMKLDQFRVWRIREPGIDQSEQAWLSEITSTLWHHQPIFILSVGALVTNVLLGEKERLSRIHGQFFELQVKAADKTSANIPMVPIFHPEFLLINPKMKQTTWIDLQNVMGHLGLNTP